MIPAERQNQIPHSGVDGVPDVAPVPPQRRQRKRKYSSASSEEASADQGQVFYMAFTWNLWDAGEGRPPAPSESDFGLCHVGLSRFLRHYGHFIYQLERGAEAGRLHFQGYIHFTRGGKRRPATFAGIMQAAGYFGVHLSAASTAGRAALAEYCMKGDTRVQGPWKDTDDVVRTPEELKLLGLDIVLRPWQQLIVDHLRTPVTDREVNVLYDPRGGMGKSLFTKYLEACCLASTFGGFTKAQDLAHLLTHEKARSAYVFDLVRTKPAEISINDIYSMIEGVKNGFYTSGKYIPQKVIRPSAHVWVFTNFLPPFDALSSDRWVVWSHDSASQTIFRVTPSQLAAFQKASFQEHYIREAHKKRKLASWISECEELLKSE